MELYVATCCKSQLSWHPYLFDIPTLNRNFKKINGIHYSVDWNMGSCTFYDWRSCQLRALRELLNAAVEYVNTVNPIIVSFVK